MAVLAQASESWALAKEGRIDAVLVFCNCLLLACQGQVQGLAEADGTESAATTTHPSSASGITTINIACVNHRSGCLDFARLVRFPCPAMRSNHGHEVVSEEEQAAAAAAVC